MTRPLYLPKGIVRVTKSCKIFELHRMDVWCFESREISNDILPCTLPSQATASSYAHIVGNRGTTMLSQLSASRPYRTLVLGRAE